MNITHKRLAFYVALIFFTGTFALLITDVITYSEAQLFLLVIAGACATLGIPDQIYDMIGLGIKGAEYAASLTPSTEDDVKVSEFKRVVEMVRQKTEGETVVEQGG